MKGRAARKVPGGKLVKVLVRYDKVIEEIKVTGDFFLHPEEAIVDIEKALLGSRIDERENELERKVKKALEARSAQLIGIQARDIALALREALY